MMRWGFAVLGWLLGIGAASGTVQTLYHLAHPGDGVIGLAFYVRSRHEDTLLDIGRHNGLGYDEMKRANPKLDMWVPGEDQDVLVPTLFVLPDAPRKGIVLNLAEKRLYYYPPEDPQAVRTYAISIGREGWNTPLGRFTIVRKDKDPAWYPPASIRKEHAEEGRPLPAVVPAGPDNPLGQYALRLSARGYLIHGTNKPWGLGMEVSHGCIRMYPENIAELFPLVPVKTPVTIVNQPYKYGWLGDDLYLEVHRKDGEAAKPPRAVIPPDLESQGVRIDWKEVEKAVRENTGLPHWVGSRRADRNWLYLDMIF